MGKSNRPIDVHLMAGAGSPHCARKIAEPIGGQQRGLIKRGNEESARKVRLVMLHAMVRCSKFPRGDIERLRESLWNSRELAHHFESLIGKTRHLQGIQEFCS